MFSKMFPIAFVFRQYFNHMSYFISQAAEAIKGTFLAPPLDLEPNLPVSLFLTISDSVSTSAQR